MHARHGSSHRRSHAQRMIERQMDLAAAGEAKRRREGYDPAPAPRGGGFAGSVVALGVFVVVVGVVVAQALRAGLF
jgi:hypothetical protein